jgi:hypothetical protein
MKVLKKLTHYIFELKMFILSNRFQVFKNQQDDTFKDSCGNISSSNILFKILFFHVLLLMDKIFKNLIFNKLSQINMKSHGHKF